MSAQLPTLALPIGVPGQRPRSDQTPTPWGDLPDDMWESVLIQLGRLRGGPLARTSRALRDVLPDDYRKCGWDVGTEEAERWCARGKELFTRSIPGRRDPYPGIEEPWRGPQIPWLLTLWNSDLEQWKRQCACQMKNDPDDIKIRTHHSTVPEICKWLESDHGKCVLQSCLLMDPIKVFVCLEYDAEDQTLVWNALWLLHNTAAVRNERMLLGLAPPAPHGLAYSLSHPKHQPPPD